MEPQNAYELERTFRAPPTALYRAFLDEATLRKISGVESIDIDARIGGKARSRLSYNGENWDFTITYKDLVPGAKLRWVVHFDSFPSKETRVTLSLTPSASGTLLRARQENFESTQERDENRKAWEGALTALETLL